MPTKVAPKFSITAILLPTQTGQNMDELDALAWKIEKPDGGFDPRARPGHPSVKREEMTARLPRGTSGVH